MTRRFLLLTLPVVALAACAPTYGHGRGPAPYSDGEWSDGPLDARIYGGPGRLHVSVNQPAHIAVFEIVPGRGVGLVYPVSDLDEERLVYGSEWLNPAYMRRSRFIFDAGLPFYQPYAGPSRFYLLVASRRPLHTGRFRHSPGSLRTVLGLHYASYDEASILDRLVENVVPPQPEEDWSTDILAVWPDPSYRDRYRQRLVQVTCSNGTVVVVPLEFAAYACRRQERREAPPLRPDSGATDTSRIARPGGRRPRPGDPQAPPGEGGETQEAITPPDRPARGHRIAPPADDGGPPRIEPGTGRRSEPREPSEGAETPAVERPSRPERPERPDRSEPGTPRSGGEGSRPASQETPRSSPPPSPPPSYSPPSNPSPPPAPRPSPPPSSGGRSRPAAEPR